MVGASLVATRSAGAMPGARTPAGTRAARLSCSPREGPPWSELSAVASPRRCARSSRTWLNTHGPSYFIVASARPGERRGVDPGGLAGHLLGPVHVVVFSRHDALRVEAAAGLHVGDQVIAAVGVRGHVADRVEEAHALLPGHLRV